MKRALACGILLLFALTCITALAQTAAKPVFVGTWKLDTAKSKYSPGATPKSQIAVISAVDGGMKVVSDRVEADGQKVHFEWTAKFDGKDYPVTGDASRDAVSVKKIDDYSIEVTNKKGGKVTTSIKAVYAKDGKSRVETVTGTNAQGQKVNNVTEWTRG
jgi:hypothetical protein